MTDRPLPTWGDRSRWWFRAVFVPLFGLVMLVGLVLRWSGAGESLTGTAVAEVLVVLWYAIVAGCLMTGLAWLAAEVRAGLTEPR